MMVVSRLSPCACTHITQINIDADKVAHAVYSPGSQAVQDIVNEFGVDILANSNSTGTTNTTTTTTPQQVLQEIDRKKLGSVVFADRSAMSVRYFFFLFLYFLFVCLFVCLFVVESLSFLFVCLFRL